MRIRSADFILNGQRPLVKTTLESVDFVLICVPHWTQGHIGPTKKNMTTQRNLVIVKSINLHKRSRPKFHLLNGFSSDQVELFAVEEATTLSLEITIRFCWSRVSFNFVVVESSSLRKGSGL